VAATSVHLESLRSSVSVERDLQLALERSAQRTATGRQTTTGRAVVDFLGREGRAVDLETLYARDPQQREYMNIVSFLSQQKQTEAEVLSHYLWTAHTASGMTFSDMTALKSTTVDWRCTQDQVFDIGEALRRVTFAVECKIPHAFTNKPMSAAFGSCLLYKRTAAEQDAYRHWKNESDDPDAEKMPTCSGDPKGYGEAQFPSMWSGDTGDTLFVPKSGQGTGVFTCSEAPPSTMIRAICKVGCYAPETRILFSSGEMAVADAFEAKKLDVVTLDPLATLGDMRFVENKVDKYIVDIAPATQHVVSIHTASGGNLRITRQHPVVLASGDMVTASQLRVGDKLLRADGAADDIAFIEEESYFGKAYNLNPVTEDAVSNIVVAEGYLNGSHRMQTKEIDYEHRRMLRDLEAAGE
jgi:hypothetical protein